MMELAGRNQPAGWQPFLCVCARLACFCLWPVSDAVGVSPDGSPAALFPLASPVLTRTPVLTPPLCDPPCSVGLQDDGEEDDGGEEEEYEEVRVAAAWVGLRSQAHAAGRQADRATDSSLCVSGIRPPCCTWH